MRLLVPVLALLVAGAANSATVVIDFEGSAPEAFNGFDIAADGLFLQGPVGSQYLEAWVATGPLTISNAEGSLFSLNSLELIYGNLGVQLDSVISAFDTVGQLIAQTTVPEQGGASTLVLVEFDSTWANIDSLTITGNMFSSIDAVLVDNISVNVIPIPAAAWLFGSALAGLGLLRRRFDTAS